ncbi:hypothetical protein SUGI_1164710 [Cryptomeria japonica]|uniref:uncharacterized protein LOC131041391 n=1 Tax=Cryptomeria japonica TaxID=3369 RepID=UPI0024149F32|nr:uncharacterized protein LOC131041391 [Cryptomeria japonica]XP_057830430.2 uncharacterized protein LOC131041391 [Cryptomeria japonica]XP_059069839.1 uncharacterized protein LOC131041391 [Cryptomeria japonica]GLJ54290.1 hypothetical protein SUGI_1164710 [Cryptomeria japonica]
MTADFYQWEVDPFFAAAEDVQDSADRMESAHRTWLHDQSLLEADPTDTEVANSIEFRKRELLIAIGTAKWQLEDFERAIKAMASSVKLYTREDSYSRHMRFIVAIQNQIAAIEQTLHDSTTNYGNESMREVNLNDQERDDFATFLSGGGSSTNSLKSSICRNASEKQIKGKIAIHIDLQEPEEMDELRLDDRPLLHRETGQSKLQGARHSNIDGSCVLDNRANGFIETGLMGKDSDFGVELSNRVSEIRDCHTVGSVERSTGHKRSASMGAELGTWKIAIADNDIIKRSHGIPSENFANRFNFWGLLGNLNILSKFKVSRSGMKRWKDGEGDTNHSKDEKLSANGAISTWLGDSRTGSNGCHVPSYNISDDKQIHSWTGNAQRRIQRSQYFIQHSRLHLVRIASAILLTLGLVGLFTFHVT